MATDAGSEPPEGKSIGELVSRLVDDGKAYARAEINLYKAIARHRMGKAKVGAILLGIGVGLLFCSLIALVLALVLGLATLIGPFGAGLAVFVLFAIAGGVLAVMGIKGLSALAGDDDERTALAIGEARPLGIEQ